MQFFDGRFDRVNQLGFTPDGAKLVAVGGSYSGSSPKVAVWAFPEGKLQGEFDCDGHRSSCLEISPDSQSLALLTPWSSIALAKVFSLDSLSLRQSIHSGSTDDTQRFGSYGIRFSETGANLDIVALEIVGLVGENRADRLFHFRWDVAGEKLTGRWDAALQNPSRYQSEWQLDPTRTWVAITETGKLLFWNVENRTIEFELSCVTSADSRVHTFSRDGTRLAFASRRSIQTFDVTNRREFASFRNPSSRFVQSLAFSPDGRTLATVSYDTCVRFWETDTGREVKSFNWKLGSLTSVTIAPDGMRAAAAGKKGNIVVWDLE